MADKKQFEAMINANKRMSPEAKKKALHSGGVNIELSNKELGQINRMILNNKSMQKYLKRITGNRLI